MAENLDDMPPLPATAVIQKKNGLPRSEKVQAAVEAGLAEIAAVREERDALKAEYDRTMALVTQAKEHITKMQAELNEVKARCMAYQIERDEAVVKHGKLQGLFVSMLAQMRAFEIPIAPVIRERIATDAEATNVNESFDRAVMQGVDRIREAEIKP